MMIEFDKAISVASENLTKLIKRAKNFEVEGALISSNNKVYEITLSYDIEGEDPLSAQGLKDKNSSTLFSLAKLMAKRREYKIFLVDAVSGKFKGFKSYKEA